MDSGPLEPADVVGGLDGFLYKGDCATGNSPSYECNIAACNGSSTIDKKTDFTVMGEEGAIYDLTIQVYGVVELRAGFNGGMRRQTGNNQQSMGDFLYEGGSYDPSSHYNAYGVRVEPAVAGVAQADKGGNNYFLNARDGTGENHEIFKVDFEMTVPAATGSKVSFFIFDSNCIQIRNNSETVRPQNSGTGTNGALVVDEVNSADPAPQGFTQPLSTNDGKEGQWLFFDVTKVEKRP